MVEDQNSVFQSVMCVCKKMLFKIKGGWGWHPNYYRWLKAKKAHPELFSYANVGSILPALNYRPEAIHFYLDSGPAKMAEFPNLNASSLVLDVGGYTGEWASRIVEQSGARCLLFEPVPQFYEIAKERFRNENRVRVFNYGLGARTELRPMGLAYMGSSAYRTKRQIRAQFRDVQEVFSAIGTSSIDLIKINIEGDEFELLEAMLDRNLVSKCRTLMVQFHDRYHPRKKAARMRERLVDSIEQTHRPVYKYPFIWECWTISRPIRKAT